MARFDAAVSTTPALAEWQHRGCMLRLISRCPASEAYRVHHCSGMPMGTASTLQEARLLIDERIHLLRQRLAASA